MRNIIILLIGLVEEVQDPKVEFQNLWLDLNSFDAQTLNIGSYYILFIN